MQRYELWFQRSMKNTRPGRLCFVLMFLLVFSAWLCGAEPEKPSVDRSRVYKLNVLSAEQAARYLEQLGIGRRVDALSESILIVTSDQPGDLIRTTSVLHLVDQKEPFVLRMWQPQPEVGLPETGYIQSQLGLAETNFGWLLDPPPPGVAQPVILDVFHGALVLVSSPEIADKVDSIVRIWTEKRLQELAKSPLPKEPEEPEEPNEPAPAVMETIPPVPVKETIPALPPVPKPVQAAPGPVAEPNKPGLAEKKLINELESVMAVQPLVEPVLPAEETPTAEEEPGTDEEYFNTELLKALTSAQENAQQLREKIKAEKQDIEKETPESQPEQTPEVPKPAPARPMEEESQEKSLMEVVEMLRRQTEAMNEQSAREVEAAPAAPEKSIDETQPETPAEFAAEQPVSLSQLQEQLSRQEQQIAELKELLTQQASRPRQSVRIAPEMSELEIPEGEEELELTITLPETVEITSLLELVGKQLGLNYMYEPSQVRGNVTLKIHEGKIKVKDLYALLESVLRFKGFIMTRRGNLVTIVPATQIKQTDPVIRSPNEPIEPGDVIVSSVFHLENVPPAVAQKMLTDMSLGTSFVTVTETNTLIVTDYAYRTDRIEKVIDMVDVAGEPKQFKYRRLQYMGAAEMVDKLKVLTAQMEGVSVSGTAAAAAATKAPAPTTVRRDARGRVIRTPTPAAQTAATAAPTGAIAEQETVFLDTDERTNRIMMIGYPDQLETINGLIDTLDVPKYYLRYVREYFIQNVEAGEIITALNELGLASVSVSSGTSNAASAAQARRTPARPGQPAAAQPAAAAPTVTTSGEDQPYISIRPNTNSLLVNGTREQHEAIELVIAHVDVKQKDQRTIHEYEIQNVDAMEVVTTLEELGIISQQTTQQSTTRGGAAGGRQTAGRQPAQQAQPGQPEVPISLPTAEGETVTELTAAEPQIAVLESTNALLINATPRQHAAIALVIAHVDRTLEAVSTPFVVYPLENQDPDELAGVLNELIQETIEQAQKAAPDAKIQAAAPAQLPTREEERIRIISDPQTYSLIVYANKKNQQWVGELIKELDEYRPQVLLDCTLVEITKDDLFKYEIDLIAKTYNTGTGDAGDYSFFRHGTDSPATGASLLDPIGFSRQSYAQASIGGGQITGFFNSDMIQGLLTAMQRDQYGRIMARPKILVNDNQEGVIKTEDIQAVAQIKTIVNPGTGVQPSTTSQDATFTDYTAGVTLTIKPHISKGDMLRLEISLNRTDFGTTTKTIEIADGAGGTTPVPYPPDRTTTDITTVSTIPDGTTIILGGLEKIKQDKLQNKVPILGDLPIIGGLFRDVNNTDKQGKLYVFVKANILRPSDQLEGLEDIRRVSGKYRTQFEEMEDKFQGMQDWPGIEPKPMDPPRILEEDNEGLVSEEEMLY